MAFNGFTHIYNGFIHDRLFSSIDSVQITDPQKINVRCIITNLLKLYYIGV